MHPETTAACIQPALREITRENAERDEKCAVKEICEHFAEAILDRMSYRGIKLSLLNPRVILWLRDSNFIKAIQIR